MSKPYNVQTRGVDDVCGRLRAGLGNEAASSSVREPNIATSPSAVPPSVLASAWYGLGNE